MRPDQSVNWQVSKRLVSTLRYMKQMQAMTASQHDAGATVTCKLSQVSPSQT